MLDAVKLPPNEIAAALVAISFAAGLNVYATLATLGLLAHAGLLPLPPALHLLTNWWVIGASAVLFLVEFFADKVPAFDLIWNALHTFIRVPVAALLAYGATSQLSPEKQLIATLLGGAIALAAHGGKTAIRAAVTPSPEPLSNIGLSLGEDALAIYHEATRRGIKVRRNPFVGNALWVVPFADPDGYRVDFESPTDVPEETEYSPQDH